MLTHSLCWPDANLGTEVLTIIIQDPHLPIIVVGDTQSHNSKRCLWKHLFDLLDSRTRSEFFVAYCPDLQWDQIRCIDPVLVWLPLASGPSPPHHNECRYDEYSSAPV